MSPPLSSDPIAASKAAPKWALGRNAPHSPAVAVHKILHALEALGAVAPPPLSLLTLEEVEVCGAVSISGAASKRRGEGGEVADFGVHAKGQRPRRERCRRDSNGGNYLVFSRAKVAGRFYFFFFFFLFALFFSVF
jgi:hypothetical protein